VTPRPRRGTAGWALAALIALAPSLRSAESTAPRTATDARGPFTVPVYDRDQPSRVVALLSGVLARFQLSNQQPLQTVRVDYFDAQGHTNLTLLGTNCTYDARQRVATSPDMLRVLTGDGRLELEGVGFTWWQTNNDIVISNQVRTRLLRPKPDGTPSAPLQLSADQFRFVYPSNLILYSGHVVVEDPQGRLKCDQLTLRRTPAGSLDQIIAESNVELADAASGGVTTAQSAVYRLEEAQETIQLTGRPEWREGQRRAQADQFVLDRNQHRLLAIGNAQLALPVGASGAPALFGLPGQPSATPPATSQRSIEVAAAHIQFQLPETNGPVRSVIAETNVVIRDPAQDIRATAQVARYAEPGHLELWGNPEWTSENRSVRGTWMAFDPVRRSFSVRTNAFVRIPAETFLRSLADLGSPVSTGDRARLSPAWIEIRGHDLVHEGTWLTFEGNVRAVGLAPEQSLGTLSCTRLKARFEERLREVQALGGVRLAMPPGGQPGAPPRERSLTCESLGLTFDAEGHPDRLIADGGVDAREIEQSPSREKPIERQVSCRSVEARFQTGSNVVEHAIARQQLVIRQDERRVDGEQAVYTGTNGQWVVTGNPVVTLPEGRITHADRLVWDQTTGRYRLTGRFQSRWDRLWRGTNAPWLPSKLGAPANPERRR